MKYFIKILCVSLAVMMLLLNTSTVNVEAHTCGSPPYRISCGGLVDGNAFVRTHTAIDSNGNTVTCGVTAIKRFHTITCSCCGALIKSNDVRDCVRKHSNADCETETYTCQQQ